MAQFVGVQSIFQFVLNKDNEDTLKQNLLLFDKICLDASLSTLYENVPRDFLTDLEWLYDKGLVCDIDSYPNSGKYLQVLVDTIGKKSIIKEFFLNPSYFKKITAFDKKLKLANVKKLSQIEGSFDKDEIDEVFTALTLFTTRVVTNYLQKEEGVDAVSALPLMHYLKDRFSSKKELVARIVLKNLPVPDGNTPLEQIVEYREDQSVKSSYLHLRRWMNKIANENLMANEIEEEIEWLCNEFLTYMQLHKIKASTQALEALIKSPLELLENLATFKFSKMVDPLFAATKQKIYLLEAEINTPGKEVSYLIKSKNSFYHRD